MRWPHQFTPSRLIELIKHQKSPLTSLQIFNEAETRYPLYRHNGSSYAAMIETLSRSGRLVELGPVIDAMRLAPCECKDSVFAGAIEAYTKAGMLGEAVSLFERIPTFNCVDATGSFHSVLKTLVERGELDIARRVFVESSKRDDVKIDARSWNLIMKALCERGRSDLAARVFVEMGEQCCYPDRETYKVLMRGLCGDGRFDDAKNLLYSMFRRISKKGSGADVVVYRTLLEALCDSGRVEEAMEVLEKVLKKGLKSRKLRAMWALDAVHYGEEDLDGLKQWINRMLVSGGVRSHDGYTAMVCDLYAEGRMDDADCLMNEMRETGFAPGLVVYEARIAALCDVGRTNDAVRVLEVDMVDSDCVPMVTTYNMVMEGLCKEGKSMMAMQYLNKMTRQVGCVMDGDTYRILIEGLCREGKFLDACRVLERMSNRQHHRTVGASLYGKVISGLCSMGRKYEAMLWLEEMISQGETPELSVWSDLVASLFINDAGGGNIEMC
ncbi:Pentatricopeptide repeat-containing protein [Acorus gramineus]|uniref:Pentatricopeptide repeat-containing protein n=1 Tax=Acorus gramineus TaxID=55184 RepID=A0AAV9B4G9_ACOGR|nr:Pentatricopeptide repeat-containing protein [Acorus gramineus]